MYYFATLLFILLSANGTFIPFFNIDWFIIEFLFLWIGFEKNVFTRRDLRLFAKFAGIYLFYCAFRWGFLNNLPANYLVSDIIYLFKYILPSFLFCALLKDQALYYLSKVIIDLTIISIPFFIIQVVGGDTLFNIGSSLAIPPHVVGYDYTNFVVYVVVKLHQYQNAGFAWEPGAFGFFLNIGLVLHFMYNGFMLDKRAKWLILGVFTTLSTTSFIALMLIFLLFFRVRGIKMSALLVVAVPVVLLAAIELPFLADKIIETYKYDLHDMQNIEFLSAYYIKIGETFPLNRFASLLFIYKTFGPKLIFGISNIYTETKPIFKNINISNGIFEFCAKFGAIGLVFLLYRAYKYFRTFTDNFEQAFYCVILILILGFGESIFVLPITTAFCFLYYYARPVNPEEDENDEDQEETEKLKLANVA